MIIDGSNDELTRNLKFDICVVGAGAAGFCIAKKFAGTKKRVCVLESSFDDIRDPRVKKPYTHESNPRWYGGEEIREFDKGVLPQGSLLRKVRPDFFTSSRTRSFGGSTNSWQGYIRPMDEHDFESWPITRNTLRFYYEEVMQTLGLGYFNWFDEAGKWNDLTTEDIQPIDLRPDAFMKTVVIQQQTDLEFIEFKTNFDNLFEKYDNLTLIKNATAVDIDIDYSDSIEVANLSCCPLNKVTKEPLILFNVQANHYVLAMGGLEIPRFLKLNFQKHQLNYPMVGQNYINHPRYKVCGYARNVRNLTEEVRKFYSGSIPLKTNQSILLTPYLVPTLLGMKKYRTKNFRIKLDLKTENAIFFELEFEQNQYNESRLELDLEAKDRLGLSRLFLDWKFTSQDARTLTGAMEMVRQTLQPVFEFEDFRYMDWDYSVTDRLPAADLNHQPVETGNDHIGAVRMNSADGYDDGILDSNLQFKGFRNLWVCSTAAFPTTGWAPPMATLMAMSFRLADKLLVID